MHTPEGEQDDSRLYAEPAPKAEASNRGHFEDHLSALRDANAGAAVTVWKDGSWQAWQTLDAKYAASDANWLCTIPFNDAIGDAFDIVRATAIAAVRREATSAERERCIKALREATFEPMPRPTIAELEAILNGPEQQIHINPDGSIGTSPTIFEKAADYLASNKPDITPARDPARWNALARWRHRKRGTSYDILTSTAAAQCATGPISEGDHTTVYQGDDGNWYVRKTVEFQDGRFERTDLTEGWNERILPPGELAPKAEVSEDTVNDLMVAVGASEGWDAAIKALREPTDRLLADVCIQTGEAWSFGDVRAFLSVAARYLASNKPDITPARDPVALLLAEATRLLAIPNMDTDLYADYQERQRLARSYQDAAELLWSGK